MRRQFALWLLSLGATLFGMSPSWAQPVEVEDIQVATYDAASDTWTLQGHPVRVRRLDLVLEAGTVRYRARETTFEATGSVRVWKGQELEVRAQRAHGSLAERQVEFLVDVQATYRTDQGPVLLEAPTTRVDFLRRSVTARGGVRLTWRQGTLHAETVSLDGLNQRAQARGDPRVTWEGLRMRAAALDADLRAQVLWASGGVRLDHPDGWAGAQQAEVRGQDRVAVLRGGVTAQRGPDRMQAEEVRYAWDRGVLQAQGSARVVVHP